jgi:inner membrane protein
VRFPLLLKSIVVAILILAIMIPLGMIEGTIAERQTFREQAVASVAQSYAGPQSLVGPVVVVPYLADVPETVNDANGIAHSQIRSERGQWTFFPHSLSIDGYVKPDEKHRGIHRVRVYKLSAKLKEHFDIAVPTELSGATLKEIGKPYLSFGIDDVRGLIGSPVLTLDGHAAPLQQGAGSDGSGGDSRGDGVHADLAALAAGQKRTLDVALDFDLGGTERLAIAPVGDSNRIELRSSWPSPDFEGRFSPDKPRISSEGFDATWDISSLAANTQSHYTGNGAMKDGADEIEINLVDPVNIYVQATRASKYGILFVLLTFAGFLMFELVKQLRIHPIQYLLVGLALAIFFLLLIGLSEHYEFVWSYLASSAACIGLQGFYLSHVLHSRARGFGFATMLTALYAALYGLLGSEDNALLLGSLMLFAILAAIMVVTRRIDWYGVAQAPLDAEPATDAAAQP